MKHLIILLGATTIGFFPVVLAFEEWLWLPIGAWLGALAVFAMACRRISQRTIQDSALRGVACVVCFPAFVFLLGFGKLACELPEPMGLGIVGFTTGFFNSIVCFSGWIRPEDRTKPQVVSGGAPDGSEHEMSHPDQVGLGSRKSQL